MEELPLKTALSITWSYRPSTASMVRPSRSTVDRAMQGSRRCRRCAAVHGRYECNPSAAVRNEWRHRGTGLELTVHLLTCHKGDHPRMQAMIRVEEKSRLHARAVYSCDPLTTESENGPWILKLISEMSECDFVFPGQVELVSSGKLSLALNPPVARSVFAGQTASARNGRAG